MGNRRFIRKSANGRFFLFESKEALQKISLENRTKLWLSSDYLFTESILQNKEETKKSLDELIRWNEENQLYENCVKLLKIKKTI